MVVTEMEILSALSDTPKDGADLISKTRTILKSEAWLSSTEADELFEPFSAIDSESDHVVLAGHSAVSAPSPRVQLSRSPPLLQTVLPSDGRYETELSEIYDAYLP